MAVKVQYVEPGPSGSTAEDTHSQATFLGISDGHLLVKRKQGTELQTVAVYAPGKWTKAETDDK